MADRWSWHWPVTSLWPISRHARGCRFAGTADLGICRCWWSTTLPSTARCSAKPCGPSPLRDFAGDGETAVRMAGDRRYDVIFMDCSMPGIGRFSRRPGHPFGRGGQRPCRSLIIALTGHVMNRDSGRWSEEGMDGYLAKAVPHRAARQGLCRPGRKGGRDAVAAPVVEPAPLPAEARPSAAERACRFSPHRAWPCSGWFRPRPAPT